ncbi:hypothetical protein PPS11_16861 [Pseudomonas putida S11]|nr:hypothetical protein PPS11_16861 [Pseudomonas putida S11]
MYAYPFIDVASLGYGQVVLNGPGGVGGVLGDWAGVAGAGSVAGAAQIGLTCTGPIAGKPALIEQHMTHWFGEVL